MILVLEKEYASLSSRRDVHIGVKVAITPKLGILMAEKNLRKILLKKL
jgi:hypothetical protein